MPNLEQDQFDGASFNKSTTKSTERKVYSDAGELISITITQTIRIFGLELSLMEIVGIALAFIALIFAIGMVIGKVPINTATISIITFTTALPTLGLLVKGVNKLRE
jgi:hypothetical protein